MVVSGGGQPLLKPCLADHITLRVDSSSENKTQLQGPNPLGYAKFSLGKKGGKKRGRFDKICQLSLTIVVQRVQKSSRDGIVKVKLTFCTAAPLQTRVTLLAAGRGCCSCPSLTLPPPTPTSCLSRPRWELSPEEERQAPPEEVLFLCLPPSPLSTSVREGGFRSAAADQQASAGRSRGRRLSELCSLSSLLARRRTAHLSGQQVAVWPAASGREDGWRGQ